MKSKYLRCMMPLGCLLFISNSYAVPITYQFLAEYATTQDFVVTSVSPNVQSGPPGAVNNFSGINEFVDDNMTIVGQFSFDDDGTALDSGTTYPLIDFSYTLNINGSNQTISSLDPTFRGVNDSAINDQDTIRINSGDSSGVSVSNAFEILNPGNAEAPSLSHTFASIFMEDQQGNALETTGNPPAPAFFAPFLFPHDLNLDDFEFASVFLHFNEWENNPPSVGDVTLFTRYNITNLSRASVPETAGLLLMLAGLFGLRKLIGN